jgi:hypothetical protein
MAKSTAKLFPFDKLDKELFKDVVFLVEATGFEELALWNDFYNRPINQSARIKKWKQCNPGHLVTIGNVDGRPVCVEIRYNILNGKKVIFYHVASQIVDHNMVERWLHRYSDHIRYDKTRWAQCDAMNFSHCLNVVILSPEESICSEVIDS